jgi:hypothetical protein
MVRFLKACNMVNFDDTAIGGDNKAFHTTRWTQIRKAKTRNPDHQRLVVENLIKKYWKPVYCYLRRKGYENEPAKDLTQGFFLEIVIGRELIQQADQNKGRFRTFLLTALDRYTSSVFQRETAKKRTPTKPLVQIDTSGLSDILAGNNATQPEFIFHYTWAVQLLDEVIQKLQQELYNDGKLQHWNVFREKVLEPILDNKTPPTLKDICQKYDVQSERKASNMIITVKRRFHALLKRYLKRFVSSESDIDEEFAELKKILSEPRAG